MSENARDSVAALRRERRRHLKQLSGLEGLIRGTFLARFAVCARSQCACHRGKRHGPICVVAITSGKRQRQHYIPKEQVQAVRKGIRQYHRLLELLDRVTAINLRLMREGKLHEERRRESSRRIAAARQLGP